MRCCENCGQRYTNASYFAERIVCASCAHMRWKNPNPIGVVLIPMWESEPIFSGYQPRGVLLGRRNKVGDPGWGQWGLPGGFIAPQGETAEECMVRETKEELNLELLPDRVQLLHSYAPADAPQVLTFGQYNYKPFTLEHVLGVFVPNDEVSEVKIAWAPEPLAFTSHTAALAKFFERENI